MPFLRFACPRCSHSLQVSDALAGKNMLCTGCRAEVTVPAAEGASPPAAAQGSQPASASSASDPFGLAATSSTSALAAGSGPIVARPQAIPIPAAQSVALPMAASLPTYSDPMASPGLPTLPTAPLQTLPLGRRPEPEGGLNVGLIIGSIGGVVVLGMIIVIAITVFGSSRTERDKLVAQAETPTTGAVDSGDPEDPFAIPSTQSTQGGAVEEEPRPTNFTVARPIATTAEPVQPSIESAFGPSAPQVVATSVPVTSPAPAAAVPAETAERRALSLTELVKLVEPAVVRIETSDGQGSGFVIDQRGTVVTNYHVIRGAKAAKVMFADKHEARVEGVLFAARDKDLAVLRVKFGAYTPKTVRVAESLPEKGESVAAFGTPLGLSFTASQGAISAIRSHSELKAAIGFPTKAFDDNVTWLQTTVPISPGSSGGPIVNFYGEVVGVATMLLSGASAQNLNFAVSATDVREVVKAASSVSTPTPLDPNTGYIAAGDSGDISTPEPGTPEGRRRVRLPTLSLPSGNKVDLHNLYFTDPEEIIHRLQEQAATGGVVKCDYPSGNTLALLGRNRDVLHGVSIALYEDGRAMGLMGYANNIRNGKFIIWETGDSPILLANYEKGKKYGYSCLLRDNGEVWIMQEYERHDLRYTHYFEGNVIKSTWDHEEKGGPPKESPYIEAIEKLAKMEDTMKENEAKVRRWLRDYHRDERKQIFQQ